ncbi:MAG: hypothetical protein A2898_02045 [Candidatus Kerfeldbacteria bacterium RIFCSPLOWO2_01_FULL_48_11]|uniref:AbiEi antitoxin C-terminal domain-containing protein n=1 Tax=Candidatus Kerfeldbacteria bacterium RIFCSPLOWO2_01_FULL_48_11 TaxID=1798543 RepID=A0A1G2B5P9_9BACT|nr:MAG: hypothetical protein A2898_02045 [Candidatus Kerfeldbacteria bacterium RIFCSPLOWO2_01_FULL_48_11]HCM68506.1 hypothetical protein [Candidatus Kerfeldbacteria bacterium]
MHIILDPIAIQQYMAGKQIKIFSSLDIQRIFNASRKTVEGFLARYVKKGLIIKLRNEFYCFSTYLPSEFEIANNIYQPSYISLDSALSHHHMIPETIYSITSITSRATRNFTVNDVLYSYQTIKKDAYSGYVPQNIRGYTILIAEPEKALADYLYFIDLKKRSLAYERLDLTKVKKEKLMMYVGLFKRPSINQLVNHIYAEFRKPQRIY